MRLYYKLNLHFEDPASGVLPPPALPGTTKLCNIMAAVHSLEPRESLLIRKTRGENRSILKFLQKMEEDYNIEREV